MEEEGKNPIHPQQNIEEKSFTPIYPIPTTTTTTTTTTGAPEQQPGETTKVKE